MRVRLTTDRATMTETHEAGDVVDLPEAEALGLIERGQAEPADEPSKRTKK